MMSRQEWELSLTDQQDKVVTSPADNRLWVAGRAGVGKTTAAIHRLKSLIQDGWSAHRILIILPQHELGMPYRAALHHRDFPPGGIPTIATTGGIARSLIDIFWPTLQKEAGFESVSVRPVFLNVETAQYLLAEIVDPLIEHQGYFAAVTVNRNHLYSQILDNMNKAAIVGFPISEIGDRLGGAWAGQGSAAQIFRQAEDCARRFRKRCYRDSLLDYSLQMELFRELLWPMSAVKGYFIDQFDYLIADNVEEDTPASHDFMLDLQKRLPGSTFIMDSDGGFRRFLGADPHSAERLQRGCTDTLTLDKPPYARPHLIDLERALTEEELPLEERPISSALSCMRWEVREFLPDMLDWAATEIADLVDGEGVPPGQIAVLSPYLPSALRFSLGVRLEERGIRWVSHRPSRPLREEPAARCLVTFAKIVYRDWELQPSEDDLALAMTQAFGEMDWIRGQLLARTLYRPDSGKFPLVEFSGLIPTMQERITFRIGERYSELRKWLMEYCVGPMEPVDHFLSRLFGEVLSQPGFGFHDDHEAAAHLHRLINSAKNFRWELSEIESDILVVGRTYLDMFERGVLAAYSYADFNEVEREAVLLSPAYSFLMMNRVVDVQFWLNAESSGWAERLHQPLTHPYVLSRHWDQGRVWTDVEERRVSGEILNTLLRGLLRRCRDAVFVGVSDVSEQGLAQEGQLLERLQRLWVTGAQEGDPRRE